ncbi:MAG: DUF4145 domain-containing protein [Chitinophagaceae bacterium]
MQYIPAQFNLSAFNCPVCGAYAQQDFLEIAEKLPKHTRGPSSSDYGPVIPNYDVSFCKHCLKYSVWFEEKLIHPFIGTAPVPNPDMPENVKEDYEEARSVVTISPRSAAALLRLALQKLCKHLGEEGKNINHDIKSLVKKGLPEKIQRAMDSVRVIGNDAVHPGILDLKDDIVTAQKLFILVNIICENQITEAKAIAEFYNVKIPESEREKISKRDKKT